MLTTFLEISILAREILMFLTGYLIFILAFCIWVSMAAFDLHLGGIFKDI